ncbi:Oxygen-dependent choline dehydrogenase [Streptomyces sp. RB17]|uniref:GMC oxidoreductase n=1 Tax=Streptomyces sp. RB17 TaxID=2585197 RepID=UPI001295E7A9|nr:GMC oxidoreductase [Streptomyces sp. RB17]MQY39940.1 Oxygen-dependent choline dehydrogenase [Streptomyces sp. RB17]
MTRTLPHHVDVVVVGSGPCGAAYVRTLSEQRPDLTLATFEAGPLLTEPPGGHVRNIADPAERERCQRRSEGPPRESVSSAPAVQRPDAGPDRRLARAGTHLLPSGYRQPGEDGLPLAAMSSNVGGMGAHWTCACPRPGDSERIPFVSGLDELLDEAERLLGVSAHAFDDAPFADEVRGRLGAAFDAGRAKDRRVAPMPLAVRKHGDGRVTWSGSDTVYGDVSRGNSRHTLFPEAMVVRVLVEQGRVRGVLVRDLREGGEHEVRAARVVVAADSLRTPQLLWASGVRPAALGRYLNDQPQVVFAVRLRDVDAERASVVAGDEAPGVVPQSGVSWVPFTDREPFHGQVMQLDASPVPLTAGDEPAPGSIVGLGWFCAKELRESDRVEFDDTERDAFGMPAMRIHYRLTERDHASLAGARAAVRRAAEALGEPLDADPRTLEPGASLHYQGTVRMGESDDGTSVCDPDSRVWGVDGLYVAGNAVIPTATACNPTLTSVALAVAGARHIARTTGTEEHT